MGPQRGGIIAALKEKLKDQVRVLVQTDEIEQPDPFLSIWLLCRRMQGDSQTRVLPHTGGALDQDAHTMWAFDIIDRAYAEEIKIKTEEKTQAANREEVRQRLLAQR